jgi:hypothetical protein
MEISGKLIKCLRITKYMKSFETIDGIVLIHLIYGHPEIGFLALLSTIPVFKLLLVHLDCLSASDCILGCYDTSKIRITVCNRDLKAAFAKH